MNSNTQNTQITQSMSDDGLLSHVLVKTHQSNGFVYDMKKSKTLLGHPLIMFFMNMQYKGESVETWMQNWDEVKLHLGPYGWFPRQTVTDYYEKYLILKKNGYFGSLFNHQTAGSD